MLEVKDSKNRHFIIGDCYNNFLYNTDQSITHQANRKLTVLPTILRFFKNKYLKTNTYFSTMQAQLTQRDHDNLIKQKIEQDNQPEKSASDTQKKRAACKYKKNELTIKKTFNFQMVINEKVLIGQIELADNVSISVSANNKVLTRLKKVISSFFKFFLSKISSFRRNTSTTDKSRNVVDSIGINK